MAFSRYKKQALKQEDHSRNKQEVHAVVFLDSIPPKQQSFHYHKSKKYCETSEAALQPPPFLLA